MNIGRKSDAELDANAEAAGEELARKLNPMTAEAIKDSLERIVETARFCHNTPELRAEIEERIRIFLTGVAKEPDPIEVACSEPDDPPEGADARYFGVWLRVRKKDSIIEVAPENLEMT